MIEAKGNINFVLVGARATGKSVYLSSLYLNEKTITAQNSRTIEYLKPLSETLLKGEYPSATSGNLHELMFNYKDANFGSSIQIDDVDGYFIETLSEKDKQTQNDRDQLINNLKDSEGIVFFFPYQKIFNENSIKEFNYQIDTIISKLKEMYEDRASIPIPAVIAISKWDSSPDYKQSDEDKKAIEYIENYYFLRLAKEKIELNFEHLKIIPLSATGKNINNLRPHNLNKPIEFFLQETYKNWVHKISTLKGNKKELFLFLKRIQFDMKIYEEGKYDKLCQELESEYMHRFLRDLNAFKTVQEQQKFEEKNQSILNVLSAKNKKKISDIKNALTKAKRKKQFRNIVLGGALSAGIVLTIWAWNNNKILLKSEAELFADISTQYNKNNHEDAFENIEDYLGAYKDTINLEHKQKILAFKSDIEHVQKEQREKEEKAERLAQKEQEKREIAHNKSILLAKAQKIISDDSFTQMDQIDEIYTSMNEMEINEPTLKRQLLEKKSLLATKRDYLEFQEKLKTLNFNDALSKVETKWKANYGEEHHVVIHKILDKAFNIKIEKSLKDISDVVDVDAFNQLKRTVQTIESLKKNIFIKKINYKVILESDNQNKLSEQWKIAQKYARILKNGVYTQHMSFGSIYEENEPLGFKCGGEDEIIVKLNTEKYHFDNMNSCRNQKISWRQGQIFHTSFFQTVKVIEQDIAEDDIYDSSFSLTNNDLIKLENGQTIKKDIGREYFIELGK